MSLIDSAARPSSSSADLQGQGKAAICPPPRAKPRAKMDAVAKPRRYFEGGAGKRPGAAAKKAEAAAPRAGAAPASSPLRRQRPPLGALSGRMRDEGVRGGGMGGGGKHPGAPAPRQRPPRLRFCKGIFRWWTRAVCHQQRQERLLLLADCADRSARDEAGRRSESLRASAEDGARSVLPSR